MMEDLNLTSISKQVRVLSLRACHATGSGHPGGCLSVADVLAALYFQVMFPQPYMPMAPDADVLVLSKGHACPALYAAHHLLGIMSEDEVLALRKLGAKAQGHPARTWTPGVVTSTGSLGQGCSFAVGLALGFKRGGSGRRVFCVLGDGDLQEGVTAEAARLASHWRLNNLVFVCDRNCKTSDVHSVDPVRDAVAEFRSWGWWAETCNGHDPDELGKLLEFVLMKTSRPLYVEARTVKGNGVSFMESDPSGYHGSLTLSDEEMRLALEELNGN